jgi:hypothetical protein
MKTFKYKGINVHVKYDTYVNNNTLAVELFSTNGLMIDVVTVNLCSLMQGSTLAFIDTNNLPDIGKWLEDNGIAVPMGYSERSGFCNYPLYAFNNA